MGGSGGMHVELQVEGLDAGHRAFKTAISEFRFESKRIEGVAVEEVHEPSVNAKGGSLELILSAATSAGAIALFRAWLSRDRFRSVTVTIDIDGTTKTVTASGDNLSLASLEKLVQATLSAP